MLYGVLRQEPAIAEALVYLVDFKKHTELIVTANAHSIQVSNADIAVLLVLYAGFEEVEYLNFKNRDNVKFVTLSKVIPTMHEFENIPLVVLDKMTLFFATVSQSENSTLQNLHKLSSVNVEF